MGGKKQSRKRQGEKDGFLFRLVANQQSNIEGLVVTSALYHDVMISLRQYLMCVYACVCL